MSTIAPIQFGPKSFHCSPAALQQFGVRPTVAGDRFGLAVPGLSAHRQMGQPLTLTPSPNILGGPANDIFASRLAAAQVYTGGQHLDMLREGLRRATKPSAPLHFDLTSDWGTQPFVDARATNISRNSPWTIEIGGDHGVRFRNHDQRGTAVTLFGSQDYLDYAPVQATHVDTLFIQRFGGLHGSMLGFKQEWYSDTKSVWQAIARLTINDSTNEFLRTASNYFFPDFDMDALLPQHTDAAAWASYFRDDLEVSEAGTHRLFEHDSSMRPIARAHTEATHLTIVVGGSFDHSSSTFVDHRDHRHHVNPDLGMPISSGTAVFFAAASHLLDF